MDDGANETMNADDMTDDLMGDLASLVAAGEIDAAEAAAMREWLGPPYGA